MKVPATIAAQIASGKSLGFDVDERGHVAQWHGVTAYPGSYHPVGYLPWRVLQHQGFDGDSYGYYWPIGREDHDPVVCRHLHHYGEIVPVASSFPGCLRLLHSTYWVPPPDSEDFDPEYDDGGNDPEEDEVVRLAEEFGVGLSDVSRTPMLDRGGIPIFGASSAVDILPYDPDSPYILVMVAEESRRKGELTGAISYASQAIGAIPEYTEGWFSLAQSLRQSRRVSEAIDAMLETFISPLYLGERPWREKCLHWLQRFRDEDKPGCEDPIWKSRNSYTLATGVKYNDDFKRYEEAIEAYHELGLGLKAVRLRLVIGDLMHRETVSFQERYGWSRETQLANLRTDLQRAGLHTRLQVLD